MDEELTIEQINEMDTALNHAKEVISLQKDIIALLRLHFSASRALLEAIVPCHFDDPN